MRRDPFRLFTGGAIATGLLLGTIHSTDRAGLLWYFTFQVCTAQMVLSVVGDRQRWAGLRTAVVTYLLVAGLAFMLVLANPMSGYAMTGTAAARGWTADVSNLLLHVVAPPLALLGWLRDRPVPADRRRFLLLLPLYPFVYFGAVLLRGAIGGGSPDLYLYPFLHVPEIGYLEAIRNGVVLGAVNAAVGALLVRLPLRATTRR